MNTVAPASFDQLGAIACLARIIGVAVNLVAALIEDGHFHESPLLWRRRHDILGRIISREARDKRGR
jgi:hypothetical protein